MKKIFRKIKMLFLLPIAILKNPSMCFLKFDPNTNKGVMLSGQSVALVNLDYLNILPDKNSNDIIPVIDNIIESHTIVIQNFLNIIKPQMDINNIPQESDGSLEPFWDNGYFSGDDARIAYAITRTYHPQKIVEIGSGNSTRFFRKAISDGNLQTTLISIDPQPRSDIENISDQIIRFPAQDISLDVFKSLEPGDILFLDGSHLAFQGTDVTFFFLQIIPQLSEGVFVHIHDINLPYEQESLFQKRFYNEQYMLAIFLLYNKSWHPIAPIYSLTKKKYLSEGGVGFWMVKGEIIEI